MHCQATAQWPEGCRMLHKVRLPCLVGSSHGVLLSRQGFILCQRSSHRQGFYESSGGVRLAGRCYPRFGTGSAVLTFLAVQSVGSKFGQFLAIRLQLPNTPSPNSLASNHMRVRQPLVNFVTIFATTHACAPSRSTAAWCPYLSLSSLSDSAISKSPPRRHWAVKEVRFPPTLSA
jgi:hypothetical protein